MTTKKATPKPRKSPGPKSKKRTGSITQSIRIPVADNKRLHRVAKKLKRSFNSWAVAVLCAAAQAALPGGE